MFGNLLALAQTIIPKQTVQYLAFTGRVNNAAGLLVSTYAEAVPMTGSFQPLARSYYAQMGLDYNKAYCNWFDATGTTQDLQRDIGGDKIIFGGKTWEALSSTDWVTVDGWVGTLFVRVPA